ncbi:hypothetical protein RDI58_008996 [Solanum bulbocastanum]|uniref:Uncharacterized protein n=1 Tax=Solanum bulbocastanum TaxID=147425 RepID=A0AAN8U4E0_SOLBU
MNLSRSMKKKAKRTPQQKRNLESCHPKGSFVVHFCL